MDIVTRAMIFAEKAHQGQVRKYTGVPYILHPAEVVGILRGHNATGDMLAAAWLHDVVEDTPVPISQITQEFGPEIARMVLDLTNFESGNRKLRKQLERERLAKANWDSQTIKYADLISNTADIVHNDPDFARKYLAEKRALLKVMVDGSEELRDLAFDYLMYGEADLP